MSDFRTNVFTGMLLVVIAGCAYYPVLDATFIWDDDNYVTNNPHLRTVNGLKQIWLTPGATPQYYPLVHTTFWLEYHLWGLKPTGYHVVNVLLHIVNAVLVWLALRQLRVPWAGLTAVVFVCHPVHVESVAWITERKNVLSGMFYLSSLIAYLRFADIDRIDRRAPCPRMGFYILSFGLFVCALLSKTVTCSLPVVILIIVWLRKPLDCLRHIVLLTPFFVIGLIMGLVTIRIEQLGVGATGPEWDWTFIERCLIAGRALWFYMVKLLAPEPLIFFYPKWNIDPAAWSQYLFPVSFVGLYAFLFFRFRNRGRGVVAAITIYAVTLFPALGFFDVYPMRYSFVADHFQYLASIPILTVFVAGIRRALMFTASPGDVAKDSRWPGMTPALVVSMCVVVLTTLTWLRCHAFYNELTLWIDTLSKNPDAWMAHNNLGLVLMDKGLIDDAVDHFERTIELKPDHAQAYHNLALAMERIGDFESARANYEKAMELDGDDIRIVGNYARMLSQRGHLDHAETLYHRILQIKPNDVDALINLGSHSASQKKYDAAFAHFQTALKVQPGQPVANYNIGKLLFDRGSYDEAQRYLTRAFDNQRDLVDAGYLAGLSLLNVRLDEEAAQQFSKVLSEHPNHVMARFQLAFLMQKHGFYAAAKEHYQRVVRLKPDYAESYNNLGAVLEMLGDREQAVENYRHALALNPTYEQARENLKRLAGE